MPRIVAYAFFASISMLLVLRESTIAGEVESVDPTARSTPNIWSFKPNCTIRWKGLIDGKLATTIVKVNSANDDGLYGGLGGPDYFTLCLNSPGGEIEYVPEILLAMGGRWITVIEAGGECHSSCAWIFMGGGSRSSQYGIFDPFVQHNPGRFLNVNGTLSFHGPEWLDVQATAQKAYSEQLKTIESLLFFSSILQQKDKLRLFQGRLEPHLQRQIDSHDKTKGDTSGGIADDAVVRSTTELMPPALFFKFLTVPNSGKYEIVDVGQALAWGIDLFGVDPNFPLDQNLVFQACANRIWFHCVQHDTCWLEEGIGLVSTVDSGKFLLSFLREEYSAKLRTLRKQGKKEYAIGELVLKPFQGDEQPAYNPVCVVRIEKDSNAITALHVATPFELVKPPAVQPAYKKFFEDYHGGNPIEERIGGWPDRNVATWIGLGRSTRLKDLAPAKR